MYTIRMDFSALSAQVQNKGNALLNAIREGKILYDKWYQLTYGLTDEQIVALPQFQAAGQTITQADLNAIRYAVGVFNDIALGNALAPASREAYLVPFL